MDTSRTWTRRDIEWAMRPGSEKREELIQHILRLQGERTQLSDEIETLRETLVRIRRMAANV